MTKSEAEAIRESVNRALMEFENRAFKLLIEENVTQSTCDKFYAYMKTGLDEIRRIGAMASAELDKGR